MEPAIWRQKVGDKGREAGEREEEKGAEIKFSACFIGVYRFNFGKEK